MITPTRRDLAASLEEIDSDEEVHQSDEVELPGDRDVGAPRGDAMVAALATLCDRLEEVLLTRVRPLSIVDAICETGENPKMLRFAFEQLVAAGRADFVGGAHRGWNLVRKAAAR